MEPLTVGHTEVLCRSKVKVMRVMVKSEVEGGKRHMKNKISYNYDLKNISICTIK